MDMLRKEKGKEKILEESSKSSKSAKKDLNQIMLSNPLESLLRDLSN